MLSELDAVFSHERDTPAAAFGSHQDKSFKIETVIFIHIFQDISFLYLPVWSSLQDSNLMKK